jgi:hypothetical protein
MAVVQLLFLICEARGDCGGLLLLLSSVALRHQNRWQLESTPLMRYMNNQSPHLRT